MQEPRLRLVPEYVSSAGEQAIELAALAGLMLDEWQMLCMLDMLGERADAKWACYEFGLAVSRQNGKGPHSLDTPILTTDGWTTFADIRAGQRVYGADGAPILVLGVGAPFVGADCYRVRFTDGSSYVVGGDHLWPVLEKDQRGRRHPSVRSTADIAASTWGWKRPGNGRMEYRYRIRCDAVPQTPEADLPIDPYIFGAWLGDGKSDSVELTAHGDDLPFVREQLELAGYKISAEWRHDNPTTWQVSFRRGAKWCHGGLRSDLRALGVFGNKHIPECYLTAAPAQRLALLQGLMDTDGSIACTNRSPQVEFSSSYPGIARDFQRLARSLGIRVTPKWRTTTHRDNCRFMWTPTFNPFRMPRKAEKFVEPASQRHRVMSIVGVERVPSVPVRCIQVDRADGVYLVGHNFTPTHNSVLEARELVGLFVLGEKLLIHSAHEQATSSEQHRRLLNLIESVPEFERRVSSAPRGKGSEAIILRGGQRIFFKTRTQDGGRGLTGDLVVLDEAMKLKRSTMGALIPTMAARSLRGNPQIIYAGSAVDEEKDEDGEVFSEVRYRALTGASPKLGWHEYSADLGDPLDDDPELVTEEIAADMAIVAQGNPSLGIRISHEYARDERGPLDLRTYAVERLGVGKWWNPTTSTGRVISLAAFGACAERDSANRIVSGLTFAVDVNPDRTWGSIAVAGGREDGLSQFAVVDRRRRTDWIVDRCVELAAEHVGVSFVVLARGPAANLIPELEERGLVVVQASGQDYGVACSGFFDAIDQATVRFPFPQPDLDEALAGARKGSQQENAWTWSRKASTSPDISPLVAVTLALWGARTQGAPEVWDLGEIAARLQGDLPTDVPSPASSLPPGFVPLDAMPIRRGLFRP